MDHRERHGNAEQRNAPDDPGAARVLRQHVDARKADDAQACRDCESREEALHPAVARRARIAQMHAHDQHEKNGIERIGQPVMQLGAEFAGILLVVCDR